MAPLPNVFERGYVRPLRYLFSGLAIASIFAAAPLRAQSAQVWINGSGQWDDVSLFWDAGVAWTAGNNAIFGGAAEAIALDGTISANNLSFTSSGFVLSGPGLLGLTASSIVEVAPGTASINAAIVSGAITKTGGGSLVLGGNNSFDGSVLISAGALRITHANALGSTVGGTTVASGAQLELSGGITVSGEALTINGGGGNFFGALQSVGGANVWAGDILIGANASRIGAVGAGASLTVSGVIDDGPSTFALAIRNADGGGEVVLSGANTYGGSTDVVVGVLKLGGSDNRLPLGTTLQVGNASNVATATFDLNGFNQQVAGLASLGTTMARTVTNSSATLSTLTVSGGGSTTYAGVVAGNLNLAKAGAGTLTLTGENTYSGTTTVNEGVLAVGHNLALGSTVGLVSVAAVGGGRVVLADGVVVSGQTIQIAGMGDNNGALQSAPGATATWAGSIVAANNSRLGGGSGGTLVVDGVISGGGSNGLVFGRGNNSTTILNAVNTYAGPTVLFANGGSGSRLVLGVDNALPASSTLATLGASATLPMRLDLNGNLLTLAGLDSGANHAGGTFLETTVGLAESSTLTLSSAATYNYSGLLTDGAGTLHLVKEGSGTQRLFGNNTYAGTTTVRAGTLQVGFSTLALGPNGRLASTGLFLEGGALRLDNTGANNNSADRLANAAVLTFRGGGFVYAGSDQAATNSDETVGSLLFERGISPVTVSFGGTNTAILTAGELSRAAGGGLGFVNGLSLGADGASTASIGRLLLTASPTLVGGSAALSAGINASIKNTRIVPYLLGVSTVASGGLGTAGSAPNTFVTYHPDTGLRPLNPTDEFTSNAIVGGDNIRLTATRETIASASINSLVIDGAGVVMKINAGHTIGVESGAVFFSSGAAPRIDGPGTLNFGGQEGVVTILSTGNTFITSPIAGSAGVTYHGTGTLVLGFQQSAYVGDTVLRVANVIPQASSLGPAGAPTSGPFGQGRLILDGSAIRATTGSVITVGNELVIRADTTILDAGVDSKNLVFTGPVTLQGGDRTIFQNTSSSTVFSGSIGDGGEGYGLRVAGSGSGALVLAGANTYSGGTVVEGVTLLVNNSSGSGTGSGDVIVAAAGTLGGIGTIGGGLATIGAGAGLSPGVAGTDGGIGTLSFGGDLESAGGSTWLIDLVQDVQFSSDLVAVANNLDIGGATLFLAATGTFVPNSGWIYTLATYGGTLNGTFAGLGEGDQVGNYLISYGEVTSGAITLTAIPEPGTLALLATGVAGFLWRRRRRSA